MEGETDSGLVSQYTGESKQRRKSSGKQTVGSESGFTEPSQIDSLAKVNSVPASSPADKVWGSYNTHSTNNICVFIRHSICFYILMFLCDL